MTIELVSSRSGPQISYRPANASTSPERGVRYVGWRPAPSGRGAHSYQPSAGRQPTYLTPRDGSVLAFAGLYEIWGPDRLLTSSIVTTAAIGELVRVHPRMPLVLPRSAWAAWLDPGREDVAELLVPDPGAVAGLELRPVGPAVGTVANDGPGLIERVDPVPTLF